MSIGFEHRQHHSVSSVRTLHRAVRRRGSIISIGWSLSKHPHWLDVFSKSCSRSYSHLSVNPALKVLKDQQLD